MISWNKVIVKLPICLSVCPYVCLSVKLNYCQVTIQIVPRLHEITHTRTHSTLSLLTEGLAEWVMRKGPHA